VVFKPDPRIFRTTEVDYETVSTRLRETAYLMGSFGVAIDLEDERTGHKDHFEFSEGLRTFVAHVNKNKEPLHPEPLYFKKSVSSLEEAAEAGPAAARAEYMVELAMQYTDTYQENVFTFVNDRRSGSVARSVSVDT